MTRRLRVELDGTGPAPPGPIRILALSDEPDPGLDHPLNREALGPIDLVVGCGDLAPERLALAFDAFHAPGIWVRGNHDTGPAWEAGSPLIPDEAVSAVPIRRAGLAVLPLSWPCVPGSPDRRDEAAAWRQVVGARLRGWGRDRLPRVVVSHAAPLGLGDAEDHFHRGFRAYRWLLQACRPVLWLHGHTPLVGDPASTRSGPTTVLNVTGSVLVELVPAAAR